MPEILSTILAKALVMIVQALLTKLVIQLLRSGLYRDLRSAAAA